MASIKDEVENGQLLAFSTRKKPASNLFLLYIHSTSTGGSIKNISGLQAVIIYCPPPFREEWEQALSRERQSGENIGLTTAGATSPVAQTVRKYLKISTDITRKKKQTLCIWFAAWHRQSWGPRWLFVPPCFWQQEHARALFPCLMCAVLVPAPCLSSQSIAKTTWVSPGFWPVPDFSICLPCSSSDAHGLWLLPIRWCRNQLPPSSPCSPAINTVKSK